jgi:hypothetical protein
MVQVEKGLLLLCDKPLRQYLIHLNSTTSEKFIVNDNIGEVHLFVSNPANMKQRLGEILTQWHDENSYVPPEEEGIIDADEDDDII